MFNVAYFFECIEAVIVCPDKISWLYGCTMIDITFKMNYTIKIAVSTTMNYIPSSNSKWKRAMYVPCKYAFNLCYIQLEHKKSRILLFFIFCVMMLLSVDVNAESSNARTGLIFGLNGGYANGFKKESDVTLPFFSRRIQSGNKSFGTFVGYDYGFLDKLSVGVEIDINYTPKIYKLGINTPGGNFNRTSSTLNIPFMLTTKINTFKGINLFVKSGINYQRISSTFSCSNGSNPIFCNDFHNKYGNHWRPVFAGGLSYQINKINLFTQYMYVFGENLQNSSNTSALAQGTITMGIAYILPM